MVTNGLEDKEPSESIPVTASAVGLPNESRMNGLETGYSEYLAKLKLVGELYDWRYEPFNLRLASPKCWYRIDFLVINKQMEVELHETKGEKVWDDALVKFKVAARDYPWFRFCWVTKVDGNYNVRVMRNGNWLK